jgi:hypothetical protein
MALYSGQFKGKCRNCDINLDINCSNVKIKEIKMAVVTVGIRVEVCIALIVASRDMKIKLRPTQKEGLKTHNTIYNPSGKGYHNNCNQKNLGSQDKVFAATLDAETFDDDIWICDSGASAHYCVSDRGMFDIRDINEALESEMVIS